MNQEYFLYEKCDNSNKLVIFLSAASSKSFTGYKLIQDIYINKLFIRDPNRSWYHNKINGVSENIDDLIRKIDKISKKTISILLVVRWGGVCCNIIWFKIRNIKYFSLFSSDDIK